MSYSQNNEEQFIVDYFQNLNQQRGGMFLEIGGYSPFKFSNTRRLYEIGFSGIYVEPSPICFEEFKKEYAKESRIQLLNYAITKEDGTMTLYEAGGDAISTLSTEHRDKWEKNAGVKYNPIIVKTMSMQTLISKFGGNIDFLNLDVEGTNWELFNLLPNDFLHRLKMICVEHDNYHNEIAQKLSPFGFKPLMLNNENLIMAK
jgi:FkbM family methyltransferase